MEKRRKKEREIEKECENACNKKRGREKKKYVERARLRGWKDRKENNEI
jgi:hypothetical protein